MKIGSPTGGQSDVNSQAVEETLPCDTLYLFGRRFPKSLRPNKYLGDLGDEEKFNGPIRNYRSQDGV